MKTSRNFYSICLLSLVCVCLCYGKAKASCSKKLRAFNVPSRPQIPPQGQEPKICVSNKSCCTLQMEGLLKQKAQKDLKDKVDRRLDELKRLMNSLRDGLKVHFQEIIQDAKRKNVESLQRLNANISRIGVPLVTAMFDQVENYFDNQSVNLTTVVMQFFRDAFPPLFNYATGQSLKFSNQYEKCLKDKVNTVQLFGSSPFRIAAEIQKVLRPMQVFLRSLSFAGKTADETKALSFTKGCPPLLLQLKYCSLCKGEDSSVKPCENYCIDVLKSCLTTSIQLQSQWSLYFDALRDLATSLSKSPNLKNVLYTVFNELSLAIYQAVPIQISNPRLKAGLFQACGQPQFGSGVSVTNGGRKPTISSSLQSKTSLSEVMMNAKIKLISFKTLYEHLPLDVCVKERISAPKTENVVSGNCWNGTALARYTGPVSSPLPSLEASPLDTLRITRLVQEINTNIQTIKKNTIEYDDEGEGSAASGDSNVISGSADCDDEDDESCYSGQESGDSKNEVDNDGKNRRKNKKSKSRNSDFYLVSTTPDPKGSGNQLDGGQFNVKGSGTNEGTALVASSTLNLVMLSTFLLLSFLTLSYRNV